MIFNKPPKILAHSSALTGSNFVTPEYILNLSNNNVNLMRRYCPHRMYPLHKIGQHVDNIVCNFHGFEWDKTGTPLNNDRKLNCGTAEVGRSGLVFTNFKEPTHQWVNHLASEKNLKFSHVTTGTSVGSWLWIMEIQSDLLHIRTGEDVVHPWLSSVENLDKVEMDQGDGWILQTCSTGWWLFIYPFTFVEYSKGCVALNYTIPKDIKNEFGFDWVTQFYYDPSVSQERRSTFEKLEGVFHEDVIAIEAQKGPYFPLMKAQNNLENHCVYFGEWVTNHRIVD
jgi:nitrite reductase/ring-hydroxylating ferredoxin subunit